MTWQELVADPNLRDLPYKIETNEWGQIVMTPTRNKHGAYQFKLLPDFPKTITVPTASFPKKQKSNSSGVFR